MSYDGKSNGRSMSSKSNYKTEQTVEEILKFPCLAIEDRGVEKRAAEHFQIRTELSSVDGMTPVAHYFPYHMEGKIVGFKKRDLTKAKAQDGHFTAVGYQGVKCELFGMPSCNKTGGKKVWVTEGEYDAAIVWQSLKAKHPQGNPNVVSIGCGTSNAVQHLGQKGNMSFLKKFPEKIVVFDNDSATPMEAKKKIKKGNEATAEVYGLIPDMLVAKLPEEQDPCDMYRNEGSEQLFWALMKPVAYTPEGFVNYHECREQAIELPKLGKPWPWPSFTKLTLGRRVGEGYYFGSGVKMGKSTLVDTLSEYVLENEVNCLGQPQRIALFKFEEQPAETIKKVAGKFYKKDFTNPERVIFIDTEGKEVDIYGNPIPDNRIGYFTHEEQIEAVDKVGPKLALYNNYGRCSWEELKGAIRHAVLVEHIEDIVIDPVTRLTAGMSSSDANTALETFADEISKMAKDLGFTYYCFCHLKSPERGKPHEFGGDIFSSQFTGSRAMMRACYYMVGLEGNKDPDLGTKEKNVRTLKILDDRKYGRTGKVKLYYDWRTGDLVEPIEGFLESPIENIEEYLQQLPEGPQDGDTF